MNQSQSLYSGLQEQKSDEKGSNKPSENITERNFPIFSQKLRQSKDKLSDFLEKNYDNINHPISDDIISFINVSTNRTFSLNQISAESILKHAKARVTKMLKNKKIKRNWSSQDIRMLIWIISAYCNVYMRKHVQLNQKDWQEISSLIPGSDAETVMFKWLGLRKNNLSQDQWKQNEKILLKQIVEDFGKDNWTEASHLLYKLNTDPSKIYRGPKQCRQQWNCYLNPDLKKGPWDEQQDYQLMDLVYKAGGQKKWAAFVKNFGGRTQNALKNRFYLLVQRQKKKSSNKNSQEFNIVRNYLLRNKDVKLHKHNFENHQQYENNMEINNVKRQIINNQGYQSDSSPLKTNKKRKNAQRQDQDWLTNFKNSHYTSFRTLEHNLQKQSNRLSRKNSRVQNKKNKEQLEEYENINLSIKSFDENFDNEYNNFIKKQEIQMDIPRPSICSLQQQLHNFNQPNQLMKKQQINKQYSISKKQKINSSIISLRQQEQEIPIDNINIIQITKQKLQQMKSKAFNYIPCQLHQDHLKLIKYSFNTRPKIQKSQKSQSQNQ